MKKLKKLLSVAAILVVTLPVVFTTSSFASNKRISSKDIAKLVENENYTEEYKNWLKLSDEEKENTVEPRKYEVEADSKSKNVVKNAILLGASATPKYSLKEVIPNNLVIKDQKSTKGCWTFAALSSLETNLALNNLKNGDDTSKVYDYSERHMEYATSKDFVNGEVNEKGYNRRPGSAGNWTFASSYLTNGQGAIPESEMPFENNENLIRLSAIQNKTVSSQVYDTAEFADYQKLEGTEKTDTINKIKNHIENYGSIFSQIYGSSFDATSTDCYNNTTGALYCNDASKYLANHAVSIIGWDDNYSKDNFSESSKPTSDGAWIIRNSWGEKIMVNSVAAFRQTYFDQNKDELAKQGVTSASQITSDLLTQAFKGTQFFVEDDVIYLRVGDNGIMYVSYEDCNISKAMYGIVKASDKLDYENIYQYDNFSPIYQIVIPNSKIVLSNVYDKKTTGNEYITEVSLNAPEKYKCKVYINPNGDSKQKKDLKEVRLKAGSSETVDAGYHTLEFETPVKITGSKYVVAIEIEGTGDNKIRVSTEANVSNMEGNAYKMYSTVTTEKNKCFFTLESAFENDNGGDIWVDLGTLNSENSNILNSDSSIKVFTTSKYTEPEEPTNPTEPTEPDKPTPEEPDNPSTPDKHTEDKKATSSDFSKSAVEIKNARYYHYTSSNNDKLLLDIEVDNIERKGTNDKYQYSYYLSNDGTEKDITNWTKITDAKFENNTLRFTADATSDDAYERLKNGDKLYVYIKEDATYGANTVTAFSNAMEVTNDVNEIEIYENDNKVIDNKNENKDEKSNKVVNNDPTVANKIIPQTGSTLTFAIVIIAVAALGIISFINYKRNKF